MTFQNSIFFFNQPLKKKRSVKEKSCGLVGREVLPGTFTVVGRLRCIMRVTV